MKFGSWTYSGWRLDIQINNSQQKVETSTFDISSSLSVSEQFLGMFLYKFNNCFMISRSLRPHSGAVNCTMNAVLSHTLISLRISKSAGATGWILVLGCLLGGQRTILQLLGKAFHGFLTSRFEWQNKSKWHM